MQERISPFFRIIAIILLFSTLISAIPFTEKHKPDEWYIRKHLREQKPPAPPKFHSYWLETKAADAGQLPWEDLRCGCAVREYTQPPFGRHGWHFDLSIKGFGDSGDNGTDCGAGILLNLQEQTHTKHDIHHWLCTKGTEPWTRHLSWHTSKFFRHKGIPQALFKASYEQMGGCACHHNWRRSFLRSLVIGNFLLSPVIQLSNLIRDMVLRKKRVESPEKDRPKIYAEDRDVWLKNSKAEQQWV